MKTRDQEVEELAKELHWIEGINSNPKLREKAWDICHEKDDYIKKSICLMSAGYRKTEKCTIPSCPCEGEAIVEKLVPLDEIKIARLLDNSGIHGSYECIESLSTKICSTFGTKPIVVPSVEDIQKELADKMVSKEKEDPFYFVNTGWSQAKYFEDLRPMEHSDLKSLATAIHAMLSKEVK